MDFLNLTAPTYRGFSPHAPTSASPDASTARSTDLVHGKKGGFLAVVAARLAAFADRLEASHWQRSLRAREAYLAQAQNIADLENRMREVDQNLIGRFLP